MEHFTLSGRVLFPDGVLRAGEVTLDGARIVDVRATDTSDRDIIAPGFVDLQVNGAFGHDLTANPDSMFHVASALLPTGVTAFLPTIITSPLETYQRAFAQIANRVSHIANPKSQIPNPTTQPPNHLTTQARILGLHLEGPYLSPQRAGAHNPAYLRPRADPVGDGLVNAHVRLMTLAPELDHGLQAIRDLRARNVVVSVGHTAATFAQTRAALDAGATWGTHLFNAMTPLHHREPGVIGALLADERATIGVIADGVHVHPSIFNWLIKAVGVARITLVTDAMAAAGLGAGEYALGDRRVLVDDTSARLSDGTLAGSILTMDQAIRNLVTWGACSLAEALTMASATSARLLGLTQWGRIAPGCAADLAVLDADLRVKQTIVNGERAYAR